MSFVNGLDELMDYFKSISPDCEGIKILLDDKTWMAFNHEFTKKFCEPEVRVDTTQSYGEVDLVCQTIFGKVTFKEDLEGWVRTGKPWDWENS